MTSYFVAGTGTGIGKTFTTCALLHAAHEQGRATHGFKPLISGWSESTESDTAQIKWAAASPLPVEEISPWRFTAPLSPHRAAALEGKQIDMDAVVEWTNDQLFLALGNHEPLVLFEAVGGVMVPLTESKTTLDWMAAVGIPIILVTGSYLGSISHTLSAMEVLRARGLAIAALVMNESAGSSVTLAEAEAGLAPFIADISLRTYQPLVSSWREATEIHALAEQL